MFAKKRRDDDSPVRRGQAGPLGGLQAGPGEPAPLAREVVEAMYRCDYLGPR